MILSFRPMLTLPPGFKAASAARSYSRFDVSYERNLRDLDGELHHLGATSAHLQVQVPNGEGDVRIDGQLRATAKVTHPGVVLTIETRSHGTLVYATDAFGRPTGEVRSGDWKSNLRAITLGLHDLRRLERYGIAQRGQQYAGFRELGSGMAMGSGTMSLDEAAELLATEACKSFGDDWITAEALLRDRGNADESCVPGAYRDAVTAHHPDVGGDPAVFLRLTEARDLLLGGS